MTPQEQQAYNKAGMRQKVWQKLSEVGQMTRDEVIEFARMGNRKYREATIERRLRLSESPCIKPIQRDGVNIGYSWICPTPYKIETRNEKKLREQDERTNALLEAARRGQAICQ